MPPNDYFYEKRNSNGTLSNYADVISDYDSEGNAVSSQTRDELIENTKSVLPGYDSLMHLCTNHFVEVLSETKAKCTYNICCAHFIGDEKMINFSYLTSYLEKRDGKWMITGSYGDFIKCLGNLKLAEIAKKRVSEQLK